MLNINMPNTLQFFKGIENFSEPTRLKLRISIGIKHTLLNISLELLLYYSMLSYHGHHGEVNKVKINCTRSCLQTLQEIRGFKSGTFKDQFQYILARRDKM